MLELGLLNGLELILPSSLGAGEFSGESDGKDTKDFAELEATKDCFRDLVRTVADLCEELDICELLRSSLPFSQLCMVEV